MFSRFAEGQFYGSVHMFKVKTAAAPIKLNRPMARVFTFFMSINVMKRMLDIVIKSRRKKRRIEKTVTHHHYDK